MNYEALTKSYWESQYKRVLALKDKINSKENTLLPGYSIPESDDLVLGEGRRLKMAVMFLDISKFSTRNLETVEEQSAMLLALNLFFTEMIKIAEDYGGVVEKNTGDGLMAYFEDNGGIPPEDGCKRAVASALTMFAANQHLISPILNNSKIDPFEFRISIDYGWLTIAKLGAAKRFNSYVAIGSTANFAAKMLSKALPGDIVIGEWVKDALPHDWQTSFTSILLGASNWVYKDTALPYSLYRYTGRWNKLVDK